MLYYVNKASVGQVCDEGRRWGTLDVPEAAAVSRSIQMCKDAALETHAVVRVDDVGSAAAACASA